MIRNILFAVLCPALLLAVTSGTGEAQTKPNIIFVMADDLGWADTSNDLTTLGHGNDAYPTPTLARMASEGMAFTNAYTSGPNCAPTRAALLTGQYASRSTNNVFLVNNLNRGGNSTMLVGPNQGAGGGDASDEVPAAAITYAETLKTVGYATAHIGKYHVGGGLADNGPTDQGFDANYGGQSDGGPGSYHASGGTFGSRIGPTLDPFAANYTQAYVDANIKPFSTPGVNADALVGTDKHVTDAMADAAISFMETHKDGPFLVNFNAYAVHSPVNNAQARADLLAKHQGAGAGADSDYAALVEGLDQSMARLVRFLETTDDPENAGQKLGENTIVIFYSDNGGAKYASGGASDVGPLKGQKGELDEGGVRVPMVAWSMNDELIDGGTVNHTPVSTIDFYQTFADLAGADTTELTLDGESLAPIFADADASLERDSIFWHLPGYLVGSGRNQRPQSVIRRGDWKLMYNYEDATWELYNLADDIGETNNLAATNQKELAELSAALHDWLKDVGAPMATFREQTLYVDGVTYEAGAAVPLPTPVASPLPAPAALPMGAALIAMFGARRPKRVVADRAGR